MKLVKLILFSLIILLISFAINPTLFAQEEENALVTVIHAVPDGPSVDVYVDGELAAANLVFADFRSALPVLAGEHRLQVTAAGASPDEAIIDVTLTLDAGMDYTVVATGTADAIGASVFPLNLRDPVEGQARINIYHLSPDAPAIDVELPDETLLIDTLTSGNVASFDIGSGIYEFVIYPTEGDESILELPDTPINAGMIYDIFVIGFADSLDVIEFEIEPRGVPDAVPAEQPTEEVPAEQPTEEMPVEQPTAVVTPTEEIPAAEPTTVVTPTEEPAMVITPTETITQTPAPITTLPVVETPAETALVSFVNASPDFPTFHLHLNREMREALSFFQATEYMSLPAGEYFVQMLEPGADPIAEDGFNGTVVFEPGIAYTVAGIGLVEDESFTIRILIDDLTPPAEGQARLSIFHFSPDAPAVNIELADGSVLFPDLAFGNGTEIEVDAGAYDIVATVDRAANQDATSDVVLSLPGFVAEAGQIYNIFVVDVAANLRAETRTVAPVAMAPAPSPEPAAPLPAPAPTIAPAPQPAPTATPSVPAALPETSQGGTVPAAPFALAAVLLIAVGILILQRAYVQRA